MAAPAGVPSSHPPMITAASRDRPPGDLPGPHHLQAFEHDLIGGGAGAHAATMWRIGLMGQNARPGTVALVLAALREVLGR